MWSLHLFFFTLITLQICHHIYIHTIHEIGTSENFRTLPSVVKQLPELALRLNQSLSKCCTLPHASASPIFYNLWSTKHYPFSDSQIILNLTVSKMPVDGLALSGAKLSAGTVMIKLSPIYGQDKHLKSYLMKAEKLKPWISDDGWGGKTAESAGNSIALSYLLSATETPYAWKCIYFLQARLLFSQPWWQGSWGQHGADRTQVGPMLAPWNLLSGNCFFWQSISHRTYTQFVVPCFVVARSLPR